MRKSIFKTLANIKKEYASKFFREKYHVKEMKESHFPTVKQDLIAIQNEIVLENKQQESENPALFFAINFPCDAKGDLIFENDIVFPLKKLEFEGKLYPCPNNTEEYLRNFYDDFMSYPKTFLPRH